MAEKNNFIVKILTSLQGQWSSIITGWATSKPKLLTINVPVVFMARCVMVLRSATSLRGALEGVGPEN